MKKKFSRILGVGLTVALLISMLVMAAPASAGTLSWGNEASVTNLKGNVDNILAPEGLDIVAIAIAGDTIYAATNDSDTPLYKSTDGGNTWASLATTTSFPSGVSVKAIAISRENTDIVAIATSDDLIEFSSNGGSSWTNLNAPQTGASINAIDVSPDGNYIAVASDNGTGAAQLSTMYLAMAQTWQQRIKGTNLGFTDADALFAVIFSPNFATDKIIAVISGDATDVRLQLFRYESGALTWNGEISFFDSLDWAGGLLLGTVVGGVGAADIELPDGFLGNDIGSRIGFVSFAGVTSGGGVIRVDDTFQKAFATWSSGDEGQISSIAYDESGKLLAGDYDSNQVYRAMSPMASSPKFERINSIKQPGGASMTQVGWSGANAVAATSGDESAFSVSTDDGYAFNDISLIDTSINVISDMAVSADGSVIYMTTIDYNDANPDTSVWVKASAWTRVYNLKDVDFPNADYLVRIAPEDPSAVYIASKRSNDMWVSKDMGKTSWKSIPVYKLSEIQDYVVESADVVYAIDTLGLTKTGNAGASWGSKKTPVDSFNAYMVTLAPNNDVLIGGEDYVAFSQDGGATLTRTKMIGEGYVQVVADDGYADNNIIYGGVDNLVKRGKADSTTSWASRSPAFGDDQFVTGMVQQNGIVYVLSSDDSGFSEIHRSLNLETAASSTPDIWSTKTTEKYLQAEPKALKASTGSTKLWAVGTEAATLSSFVDAISDAAPTMKSPADNFNIPVNPGTGQAYNVTYSFDRQNTSVSAVQLQISTDDTFDGIVYNNTFTGIITTTTAAVIGPTGATNLVVDYMPGNTYYWRVRTAAAGPMYSPWSATRSIKVDSPVAFTPTSPVLGATDVGTSPTLVWSPFAGAIHYEITVSKDSDFTFAEYSHNVPVDNTFYKSEELDYDTTYYWRVRGVTGPAVGRAAAPGGPWTTGVFTTMAEPSADAAPPVVITEPGKTEVQIVEIPVPGPVVQQAIPDYLLWVIVVIGAVLIIALIILIVRTRRVA
jgi:hypothetical protein